ncbi:MAG: peptidoglycan DD-metalloendopeptidase family protein [Alphaproteobacteria bacterium]|nr:peptidoglycan DD-metalloendopeptidase family protein [Alphaproteobacteria bacterium]MDP6567726.1 peptidoglycan DD-metalloendopeptidase family protein [Alphaproteobacteria bacterium]MDP6812728.1 peptidoglycan DD-metalloendopeptidase family protein [Alphaproteobacteria bacterium]
MPLALPVAAAAEQQEMRSELREVDQSIEATRQRQRQLSRQARRVVDQIAALRLRLVVAARQAQKEEAALDGIDRRLEELGKRQAAGRAELEKLKDGMALSLAALARIGRQPPAAVLAAPGSTVDAARGGRLLAVALPAMRGEARRLGGVLRDLAAVRRGLADERRRRATADAALSQKRGEIAALLKERAGIEADLRRSGAAEARRLGDLATRARDLRTLMQQLSIDASRRQARARAAAEKAERVARLRRIQERDEKRLAAEMAKALRQDEAEEAPADTAGDEAPPRLALAPGATPFSKVKGRLPLPAKGRLVGRYGESTGFGPRAQGITLLTRERAQVVAPHDGWVVFAGPFRDYGQILIISHGEGYHTLLAGMSRIHAVVGQSVLVGEPVGRMGDGDSGSRSLYIELRRKGAAIDPRPWWAGGDRRVSG